MGSLGEEGEEGGSEAGSGIEDMIGAEPDRPAFMMPPQVGGGLPLLFPNLSDPAGSAAAGVAGGGGGTPSPLDILRHDPQFIQIRADVQQNPQSLHEVLTLLQQTQPGLMEIITQNQEEFVRFLQEPVENQNA